MEALKTIKQMNISTDFDKALKGLLTEELKVFKSTRGRFLCNNQRYHQNPLVA